MANDHLNNFDKTVDRIKRQQEFGFSCYAFLSGVVDDVDRKEKYNASYAGHALDLCIRSIQTSLVLFCSRHWDPWNEQRPIESLPSARVLGETALEEIIARHRAYFEESNIQRNAEEFRSYFGKLAQEVDELARSEIRSQIRVLRTEQYAHLTTNSSDRQNAVKANPEFDTNDVTVKSLLDFTETTLRLGSRFIYLKELLSPEFEGRVSFIARYHDRFWDNLPNFSETEEPI